MPFFQEMIREHGSKEAAFAALVAEGGASHITGVELPGRWGLRSLNRVQLLEALDCGMSKDTTPEAARIRLQALRSLPGATRLEQALDLSDAVRALSQAGRRAREIEAQAPRRPGTSDDAA